MWDSINLLALPRLLFFPFFQLGLLKLGFHSNTLSSAVISLSLSLSLSLNIRNIIERVLHHCQ